MAQYPASHMACPQMNLFHVPTTVKESYFATMGEALFHMLENTLKDDWNSELKVAWQDVYFRLSSQMVTAMKASKKQNS